MINKGNKKNRPLSQRAVFLPFTARLFRGSLRGNELFRIFVADSGFPSGRPAAGEESGGTDPHRKCINGRKA